MKKTFKIQDLDCAHCAGKIEAAIRKLEGVNEVKIAFFAQKITIDAVDDRFDAVLNEAKKIAKDTEPDCRIVS